MGFLVVMYLHLKHNSGFLTGADYTRESTSKFPLEVLSAADMDISNLSSQFGEQQRFITSLKTSSHFVEERKGV